jgi:hypothetical protein
MKVTAGQLYAANPFIGSLAKQKLPIRASVTLARNLRVYDAELKPIQEKFMEIVREHGTETEPGQFSIQPEFVAETNARIAELMAVEIDAPFHAIKVSDIPNIELSPEECGALSWLIVDDAEAAPTAA